MISASVERTPAPPVAATGHGSKTQQQQRHGFQRQLLQEAPKQMKPSLHTAIGMTEPAAAAVIAATTTTFELWQTANSSNIQEAGRRCKSGQKGGR